ncbi:MAG: ASCH domain-containing protein [Thermogemmata sp.]|jgi:hypothetical protein|uniref:ASCH domain-containing protein n=1 Tax=Thermogemmata fonticola TaxID=2755323 RepID=A0A7V8VF61_9BACT|nr:ASCH domain-containing protein [Thermogemmata fonticola]MBA2226905.1 ASCH domain-containing protein [Thermogemmata fonticola]
MSRSPSRHSSAVSWALSVRQPWAGLLVAGVKTIELRRWAARHRGWTLIHAAQWPAGEALGWRYVAEAAVRYPRLWELCTLRGGIIGMAELVECVRYTQAGQFAADSSRHLQPPEAFHPGLYGFLFRQPRPLPYYACKGQTFFFPVEGFHTHE